MLAVALALVAAPADGRAATQIGTTLSPNILCDANMTYLQSSTPGNEYAAAGDGVITSWSFQGGSAPPRLEFKLARELGDSKYLIVGEGEAQAPIANAVNTYPVRVPARAGDVIGFYTVTAGDCRARKRGYVFRASSGDVAAGSTATFPLSGAHQFDLAARLEPDLDGDGYGDETQDLCPGDAATQSRCETASEPPASPPPPALVECLGAGARSIAGSESENVIIGGPGADAIDGAGGDDELRGVGGADCVEGGSGGDLARGGSGTDRVSGGRGADVVRGGIGADELRAGSGVDLVDAVDGERDQITCGAGDDTARVDAADRVRAGCEQIIRASA